MPTVPSYDNFRATPSTGGVTTVQPGYNDEAATGEQLQRTGVAMQNAGGDFARIAIDAQQVFNQTRVNDAVNQARVAAQNLTFDPQVGYASQKGLNALQRESGQALPEEYGGKLSSQLSTISGNLTNDEQRRLFQQAAGGIATQFHGDVEQHMMREATNYRIGVNDATIDLAANDAKTYWNDPDKINAALGAMQAATVEKMRTLGMEGAPTDAALLTQTSKVHSAVVMSALENGNPNYALGYLDRHRGEMTADDTLRLQGHVNQQVWAGQAMGAVQAATQAFQPKLQPSSFDRMAQITAQAESGGRDTNADGSVLTSPKGAKGSMQVLDSTMRSPGLPGVQPLDPATATPAQRAQFGRDYLRALVQRYGDPGKAWAAYNAGFGAVDAAVKSGGESWLAQMPQETQKYVAANVASLNAPIGLPRPVESDFVSDAIGRLPPGASPQVVKMTREQAVSQFGVINKSIAERGDNAVRAAQQWIATAPQGATIDQMPPSLRAGVVQYAPDKFVELEKLSKALQRGDTVTNLGRFNDVVSNMADYAHMSDTAWNQMQTELAPVDFKSLSKERATYQQGQADTSYQSIDTAAVNQGLKARLESLQIPVSPKPTDTAGRERLGGIQQYVRGQILAQQQQTGHKFKPSEVEDALDSIFAKDATFKTSFFGIPTGSDTKPLLAMTFDDLPSSDAAAIKARLVKEGIAAPTNNQVLNRYRTVKASAGGQ